MTLLRSLRIGIFKRHSRRLGDKVHLEAGPVNGLVKEDELADGLEAMARGDGARSAKRRPRGAWRRPAGG